MTRSMSPEDSRDYCAEFAKMTADRLLQDGHGPLEIGLGMLQHACRMLALNAGLSEQDGVTLFVGATKAAKEYVDRAEAERN